MEAAMTTVAAVVLTWNRKQTLSRCLAALEAQSRPPDRVVVVDNASTDGTQGMLEAEGWSARLPLEVRREETNRGASAGFRICFAEALDSGADYAWLMDDDVLPAPDALAELLAAADALPEPFSFLASRVVGLDGRSMNVPEPDLRTSGDRYPDWEAMLDRGLAKIRRATFVSVLIPRETLQRVAPPSPDFVMWGDDADWSLRATAWRPAWAVGRSVAVHARATGARLDAAAETDPARIRRMFYFYRNEIYIARRHYGPGGLVRVVGGTLRDAVRGALGGGRAGRARLATVLKGFLAGARFRPSGT
jgi:dTDP-4-dehydrorhamnose reductase